jgi:beta-glucanase (GH16 family)
MINLQVQIRKLNAGRSILTRNKQMDNNYKKNIIIIVLFLLFCCALLILQVHLSKNHKPINPGQASSPGSAHNSGNGLMTATTTAATVPKAATEPNPTTGSNSTTTTLSSESTTELLQNMHATFDDEFNSFSRYVDSAGNITCNSGGSGTWQTVYYFCSRTIFTNYEAEVYIDPDFLSYFNSTHQNPTNTPSPFTINNGILSIEAAPIDPNVAAAVGGWAKYTSGLITTQFSFSQQYGYFEMRAKLPEGKGLWPAFWLLPVSKQWPPEIDAMEAFGGPNPKGQGGTTMIHYESILPDQTQSCGAWHDVKEDITQGFHTYGVDVEPSGITYYFDGQAYAQCPPNPEANQPFYMLIDLAVGSDQSWPGSPDATNTWPAYLDVDYVRAYQNN